MIHNSELIILTAGVVTTVTVAVVATHVDKAKLYNGIDRALYKFLECADNAYTDMYTTKDIYKFAPFATEELCLELSSLILQDNTKILGTKHCALRSWSLIQHTKDKYSIEKRIDSKKIQVTQDLNIDLVDNIREVWNVICRGNKFIVEGIQCL